MMSQVSTYLSIAPAIFSLPGREGVVKEYGNKITLPDIDNTKEWNDLIDIELNSCNAKIDAAQKKAKNWGRAAIINLLVISFLCMAAACAPVAVGDILGLVAVSLLVPAITFAQIAERYERIANKFYWIRTCIESWQEYSQKQSFREWLKEHKLEKINCLRELDVYIANYQMLELYKLKQKLQDAIKDTITSQNELRALATSGLTQTQGYKDQEEKVKQCRALMSIHRSNFSNNVYAHFHFTLTSHDLNEFYTPKNTQDFVKVNLDKAIKDRNAAAKKAAMWAVAFAVSFTVAVLLITNPISAMLPLKYIHLSEYVAIFDIIIILSGIGIAGISLGEIIKKTNDVFREMKRIYAIKKYSQISQSKAYLDWLKNHNFSLDPKMFFESINAYLITAK